MIIFPDGSVDLEGDRSPGNVLRAVRALLARAWAAHQDAMHIPSAYTAVLEELAGEVAPRSGFCPDRPAYQDWLYSELAHIREQLRGQVDADSLEMILEKLTAKDW